MESQGFTVCQCEHCDGNIEFPTHGAGESVLCPHCGTPTVLRSINFTMPGRHIQNDPAQHPIPKQATKSEPLMMCPFCQKPFPRSLKFCPHCGKDTERSTNPCCRSCRRPLPLSSDFCPYCRVHTHSPKSMSVCSACMSPVSTNAANCPHCGEPGPSYQRRCPCGGVAIADHRQGYSLGKGLAFGILTGGVGLLAGLHGKNKLVFACRSCRRKFKD